MSRRPRGLHPDEQALWQQIARSARALHPERPVRTEVRDPPVPAAKPPESLFQVFRLGEKLRPHPVSHDLAPLPRDHLAAQPIRMDHKTFERMTRGKLAPEARIDLHGMTLSEAHGELIRFMLNVHAGGRRLILVITGKGRPGPDWDPVPRPVGILRQQVPVWLARPPLSPLVQAVGPAHQRHGGAGAVYVWLRNGRSPR